MANDKFTAQKMIDALMETKGMITLAARRLSCSSNTVRRYIAKYPSVKEAQFEAHEEMGDGAELKLFNKAMGTKNNPDGDTTALIFLLKTQYKQRGYVERTEHMMIGVTPELERRFREAAQAAGITPGDALEAFVQELARAQSTTGGTAGGA